MHSVYNKCVISEVGQDAAEGGRLACRVSCVMKPNLLVVSLVFLGLRYGKGSG